MALERSNPLPPNQRYWVDVPPADQPSFDAWLTAYASAVAVVSAKLDPDNGWQWVLFDVTAPLVFWVGPGYPTIADPGVTTEEQVKQIPTVSSSLFGGLQLPSGLLFGVLGGIVGVAVLQRVFKR